MNFTAVALISLSAFFSGGAIASVFCIIFGRIFKKRYLRARFSIIFIFLSIAIVSFSLCFFVAPDFLSLFPLEICDLLFFLSIFALGLLVTRFWKIALPSFLVLYIGFSFYFALSFYKAFGISDDTRQVVISNVDDAVDAEIFVLNEKILLPLPRVWYRIKVSGEQSSCDYELNFLSKKLIGRQFVKAIGLPDFSVIPAIFNVKCTRTLDDVLFSVEKSI